MNLPYRENLFGVKDVEAWAALHNPTEIGMSDKQYAWFCNLMGMNLKTVKGIPIFFTDAPKQHA